MTEQLVIQVPTEEQLADFTYQGLSFHDYRALADEDVAQLHEAHQAGLVQLWGQLPRVTVDGEDGVDLDSPEWPTYLERYATGGVLTQFAEWRRDGLPDRDMTETEAVEQVEEYLATLLRRDPDFGAVPAVLYELPEAEQDVVDHLFNYFDHHRSPTERVTVGNQSLINFLGLDETDVESLERTGVLQRTGADALNGDIYLLTQPFQNCWLTTHPRFSLPSPAAESA